MKFIHPSINAPATLLHFFKEKCDTKHNWDRINTELLIFLRNISSETELVLRETSNTIFVPWMKTKRYTLIRILRDTYGITCISKKCAKEIENDAEATPSASCIESRDETSNTRCETRPSFSVVENEVI